ncbi:MAG TPA: acyltransferase [Mycobacteriales bacterium]|nr:acyltransferase [Mycobacteriales bacterium]
MVPARIRSTIARVGARVDRSRSHARVRRFRRRARWLALWRGAHVELDIAPTAEISRSVRLEIWRGTTTRVAIGERSRVGDEVKLSLRGGSMTVGANTDIRRLGTYHVGGELTIGSGVVLSTGLHLHCAERVRVGDLTIIGEYSTIADSRHLRTPAGVPIHHATATAPVDIGENIWMGAHVVIAGGTVVGDLAFVAAGAVVTRDVRPRWLVAGVPAREIRELADEVD